MKQFLGETGQKWTYDPGATLGRPGGFGAVHLGKDEHGASIAVKVVPRAPARGRKLDTRLLHREMEIGKKIREADSKYLIRLLDVAETKSALLLVMELGEHALSTPQGGLDHQTVVSILSDIACGLSDLHQLAIIHRDLKPSNVIRHDDRWKLADFGISHDAEIGTQDPTFKGWGTWAYMAPELWELRSANVKSDLYALGCLAYELSTGALPFQGPAMEDYRRQHLSEAPPSLGHASSSSLASLVSQLLRKDPASRPQDGRAVIERLQRIMRPHTEEQKRLQVLAMEHEQERTVEETAKAARSDQDQRRANLQKQLGADLMAACEEARVFLLEALPGVQLKEYVTGFGTTLESEHAKLGFRLWDAKPSPVDGDTMVRAGEVVAVNRRNPNGIWRVANFVFEAIDSKHEWQIYRFEAGAWVRNYRYGPSDQLHGLEMHDFLSQRLQMLLPVNHVWKLTRSSLRPELIVSLFEEAMKRTR